MHCLKKESQNEITALNVFQFYLLWFYIIFFLGCDENEPKLALVFSMKLIWRLKFSFLVTLCILRMN